MSRVGEFNPQEIADTAWAFATACQRSEALFAALAAKADHRNEALFAAVTPYLGEFSVQELVVFAWPFVSAGIKEP